MHLTGSFYGGTLALLILLDIKAKCSPISQTHFRCGDIELRRRGCFAINMDKRPFPIPIMLFTDLDPGMLLYSNYNIERFEEKSYIKSLICRCAKSANKKGYSFIGLHNHGECWSGDDSAVNYPRDGPSDDCVAWDNTQCHDRVECIGEHHSNFVYKLQRGSLTLPTAGPTTISIILPSNKPTLDAAFTRLWSTMMTYPTTSFLYRTNTPATMPSKRFSTTMRRKLNPFHTKSSYFPTATHAISTTAKTIKTLYNRRRNFSRMCQRFYSWLSVNQYLPPFLPVGHHFEVSYPSFPTTQGCRKILCSIQCTLNSGYAYRCCKILSEKVKHIIKQRLRLQSNEFGQSEIKLQKKSEKNT